MDDTILQLNILLNINIPSFFLLSISFTVLLLLALSNLKMYELSLHDSPLLRIL